MEGNTVQSHAKQPKFRWWAWTLNNYTEEELAQMKVFCEKNCDKYGYTKEIAPTTGTPHLQGFWSFKNARYKKSLEKTWPRVSMRRCEGSEVQNKNYIIKTLSSEIEQKNLLNNQDLIKIEMMEEYKNITWKPWQQHILNIIKEGGSNRTINWVYDPIGNNGKTFLRRYICLTNEAILADGKKENIFYAFKVKCIDENKRVNICVMDIPRQNERFVNYGTIEAILDRHLYSGKYEGGEIWLPKMTVIIFSNFYPDLSECTKDRWNIIDVGAVPPPATDTPI